MATIETRREEARGCGFRKGGGIYLVNDGAGRGCGRMPIPLHSCPTCSQGFKPARGWTWVDGKAILETAPACRHAEPLVQERPDGIIRAHINLEVPPECSACPFSGLKEERVGLLWVGGKFYETAEEFTREAVRMGISRRISQIPKELVVGQTWIWLAHRKVMPAVHDEICPEFEANKHNLLMLASLPKDVVPTCTCEAEMTPGIFHAFVPTRIEYVVKGDETEEDLDALEKRGLTLVKVERIGENGELVLDDPNPKENDDGT